jgi:hypothetical protein
MRRVPITITLRGDEYEVLSWHVREHCPGLSVEVLIEEVLLDVVERIIQDHRVEEQTRGDAPDGHGLR